MDRILETLKKHIEYLEKSITHRERDRDSKELDVFYLKNQIAAEKEELDQARKLIEKVENG